MLDCGADGGAEAVAVSADDNDCDEVASVNASSCDNDDNRSLLSPTSVQRTSTADDHNDDNDIERADCVAAAAQS